MSNRKASLADFLQTAQILIENARNLPEIAMVLKDFGYTEDRWSEGVTLLGQAQSLVTGQSQEYGQQHQATVTLNQAWEKAHDHYMKTLKLARIALADDANAANALKLYGPRQTSLAGWLGQASTFYANLSQESTFSDQLSRFGYSPAKIDLEYTLVKAVQTQSQVQAKETGEAQQATQSRDAKLAELDAWVSELKAVCKVAFSQRPQELEKLGISVLNSPRKKTVVAEKALA